MKVRVTANGTTGRKWRHASATDRRACAEHWTRSEATLEMMMMMCLAVFGLCLAVFGLCLAVFSCVYLCLAVFSLI